MKIVISKRKSSKLKTHSHIDDQNSDDTTDSQDSNINMPLTQSSESVGTSPVITSSPKIKKHKKMDSGVVSSWDDSLTDGWKSSHVDDDEQAKRRAIARSLMTSTKLDSWDDTSQKDVSKKLAIEKQIDENENKLKRKSHHDEWDEILDLGRKKKIKEKKIIDESIPNEYQKFLTTKPTEKANRKIGFRFKSKVKDSIMDKIKARLIKNKRK